jgi:hypothetical protein
MDLNESIKDFLDGELTGSPHVGEVIPQEIDESTNYVWFQRSGDLIDDNLNHPPDIIAVVFDFEIVSADVDESRELVNECKMAFLNAPFNSVSFNLSTTKTQTVHAFDAEDHDDSYLRKITTTDESLFIGSFRLTAHLGKITTTP